MLPGALLFTCSICAVRFAYFDEAGISNLQQEPVVVVGGVLVDADQQWKALKEHFTGLVERFVPADERGGFVFHATDIWQGKGVFDRKTFTGDRHKIIDALCDTIIEFKLPVMFGKSAKEKVLEAVPEVTGDINEINRVAFMSAFADCALDAERWMREWAPKEVAVLVAENNNDLRRYAKVVHTIFTGWKVFPSVLSERVKELPFIHLVDTVYFAEKREAPPLQLADLVSFLFKRWLSHTGEDKIARQHLFRLAPLCPSLMGVIEAIMAKQDAAAKPKA